MGNGSSGRGFVPAFIAPRHDVPDFMTCRWDLIAHGADPCERTTQTRYVSHVILCKEHQQELARSAGFISKGQATRDIEARAARVAATRIAQKDETIAYLRRWLQEERRPTKAAKTAPTDGVVYFLRVGGFIKIGWTSNLEKRMRGYQPDTILLATKPGTRKDERALHRKFAHLKTHGREWFPLAPQIMEEVERTVADHGEPPAVDFSARRAKRIVGPRLNQYIGGPGRGQGPASIVRG